MTDAQQAAKYLRSYAEKEARDPATALVIRRAASIIEGFGRNESALLAENARLREALSGLYQALRERHHGRMPDDVRIAYERAGAALEAEADQ